MPVTRPMPRKHAGALLAHDLVKRAAVGAVSASRPQQFDSQRAPQQSSGGSAGDGATAVEASQQAGAELLTWLNNAVPATRRTPSPAGKGGAAGGQPAAALPASDPAPLRRPVSDSHLWVRVAEHFAAPLCVGSQQPLCAADRLSLGIKLLA